MDLTINPLSSNLATGTSPELDGGLGRWKTIVQKGHFPTQRTWGEPKNQCQVGHRTPQPG